MIADSSSTSSTFLDLKREKQRVIDLLKIPISSVSISRFFCELFIDQHSIGHLPLTISNDEVIYDFGPEVIKKINWSRVYRSSQREINYLIQKQLMINSFHAIPTLFRRVYVEDDKNILIASFECRYENSAWKIIDEKILAMFAKKS